MAGDMTGTEPPRGVRSSPRLIRMLVAGALAVAAVTVFVLTADGGEGEQLEPWELAAPLLPAPSSLQGIVNRPALRGLVATTVVTGLEEPSSAAAVPATNRFYVLEKPGRVRLVVNYQVHPDPVLDLTGELLIDEERGLVGIALHPEFALNGRAFLSFTDLENDLVIAEYHAVDGGTRFHPLATEVLRIAQPGRYHHGGTLRFGPDGYLWIGLGDGGGVGGQDPHGHGQNPATILGTLIRIDVDESETFEDGTARPYRVPPDNPFVGSDDGADEIWAYGFRNPWGFALDRDLLYVADVGHTTFEEINVLPIAQAAGANFGWSIFEGPECMQGPLCDVPDLVPPVLALDRERLCAVIGGPVYRGAAIPEIGGRYFFGDYCVGWVRSIRVANGVVVEYLDWSRHIPEKRQLSAFFTDGFGEMHLMYMDGTIIRIEPAR